MSHEKILAIDDSRDNLTALQAVLRDALPGCVVLTTTSGPQGIELARCEDPDVILLDIAMPGMDGFEVCRRLKEDERLQAIPVVFLTALRTDRESRIRALETGAEGFLTKPLDELELVAQVRAMARLKVASRLQRLGNEQLTLLVAERTRELEQELAERRQTECALRESEEEFRSLAEAMPQIVWATRKDGWNTYFNQQWVDYTGLTLEESYGHGWNIPFHPDDQQRAMVAWQNATDTGGIYSLECRLRRADGAYRWWLVRGVPLFDKRTGEILKWFGTCTDIEDIKRAEAYRTIGLEALAVLNEPGTAEDAIQLVLAILKARTGFDAVGIRLKDGDDFPYIAQQGFSTDFLLTENTLVERGADGGVCLEGTCGLVISGKTDPSRPLFTRGGSFWTNDSIPLLELPPDQDPRLHPRNQCIHLGYASVALVPIRDKDRIVGLIHLNDRRKGCFTLESVEMLEEIAAHIGAALTRKRAEEELREAQAILHAAMDQSTAGIAIADAPSGVLRYVNDAGLLIRGGTRETVVNGIGINQYVASWGILDFDGQPLGADEVPLSRAIMFGETCSREFIIRRADCDDRVVFAKAAPIKDAAGRITAGVVVFVDTTGNRAAEAEREKLRSQLAQAQKMESVGRLAGGVAHDFNNQLMGIMNYVELCRDELPPGHPVRGHLDEITRDAQRSADIAKQLLAFARKQVIAPKVLDMNDALAGMLKMLRHLMGEDIELTWGPGAAVGPVKMDPGQLDQILANLCVNARDAIAGVGKVTIETANTTLDDAYCAMHADAVPGDYIRLSVSDSGCGMSKDVLAHIFEPFYTTKEVGKGTGLGLATVYGIVEQNHGHIEVQSEPGKGTTFSIYLPRAASEADTGSAAVTPERLPRGTETIVLAEDEKSVRVTSRLFLEALGYTVLAAGTPEEALRLGGAHSGSIHLLITDVIMPGMNGPDLAAFLAGERPNLKCLFISGYTADVIMHRGTLGAAGHFLAKPFSRHDLACKVREVLDGR